MLYSFNRRKLGRLPMRELPVVIAACCQIDDSSPWFSYLRPYLVPATSEDRLVEFISDFNLRHESAVANLKVKRLELQRKSERLFDNRINTVQHRIAALAASRK